MKKNPKNQLVNVRVTITPNNIRSGTPDSIRRDALNLALGRIIEKRSFFTRTYHEKVLIFSRKTSEAWCCSLPKKASRFLEQFDNDKNKAKPMEFVLKGVPTKVLCKNVKPLSVCQELFDEELDVFAKSCDNCPGCK